MNRIRKLERVVIKGSGGSGKTVFFKYLWLTCFVESEGRIPLFVELRRLNDLTNLNLIAFCRSELQSNAIFSDSVFEKLCEDGKFLFIFDGFDELRKESRAAAEKQIIDLSYRWTNCGFVVSSRDDDRFNAWQGFEIYSVCTLSRSDVKDLISRITFDEKTKKNFLSLLTKDFFQENIHFLSSPLLATMMLMTFFQNASIPDRLSSFYKNALLTLLLWHDATKDSFERERVPSQESFRTLFAVFSFITYYEGIHEFEEDDLRAYIRRSLDYVGKLEEFSSSGRLDVDDIKQDFWQSANLLQKDGLTYLFLHRSFQEYFAAEFAMTILNDNLAEVLNVFSQRNFDRTLQMCFEIQEDKVIDEFIIPAYRELSSAGLFECGVEPDQPFKIELNFKISLRSSGVFSLSNRTIDGILGGRRGPQLFFSLVELVPNAYFRYDGEFFERFLKGFRRRSLIFFEKVST
ncbi:MAG: NACHT domain-containing protein [Roseicyclus sp.]|nr:NACHT domain-containing protein [Roseicyclus sp.]MBO6921850.1 NACHT domain-containing protein [Roseicyclus sp.]